MQTWLPPSDRAHKPTTVERWADLESKSDTMRDELCLRHEPAPAPKQKFSFVAACAELAIAALHALSHFRSK